MNMFLFYRLSGIFFVLVASGFAVSQMGIAKLFDYPKILRSPVDIILRKYADGGKILKFFWSLFAFSSLMLIPVSALLFEILKRVDTPYLLCGAAFGMASGIFYVFGIMRWVFLADSISKKYTQADSDAETKKTLGLIFQAFHIYSGNSIGETMGFVCMGLWSIITGAAMVSSSLFYPAAGFGFMICGPGIFAGPFEWLGFRLANKINKISMKAFMLLLLYVGIRLLAVRTF